MTRLTQTDLEKTVSVLAERLGKKLMIEWSYGQPRVALAGENGAIEKYITPRDRIGLVDHYVAAMVRGIDLKHDIECTQ